MSSQCRSFLTVGGRPLLAGAFGCEIRGNASMAQRSVEGTDLHLLGKSAVSIVVRQTTVGSQGERSPSIRDWKPDAASCQRCIYYCFYIYRCLNKDGCEDSLELRRSYTSWGENSANKATNIARQGSLCAWRQMAVALGAKRTRPRAKFIGYSPRIRPMEAFEIFIAVLSV